MAVVGGMYARAVLLITVVGVTTVVAAAQENAPDVQAGGAAVTQPSVAVWDPDGLREMVISGHRILVEPQRVVVTLWDMASRVMVVSPAEVFGTVGALAEYSARYCSGAAGQVGGKHTGDTTGTRGLTCVIWNSGLPDVWDPSGHPRYTAAQDIAVLLGCGDVQGGSCKVLAWAEK